VAARLRARGARGDGTADRAAEPSDWARERLERCAPAFATTPALPAGWHRRGSTSRRCSSCSTRRCRPAGGRPSGGRGLERAYREARPPKPRTPDAGRDADPVDGALRFVRPLLVAAVDALCDRAERRAKGGAVEDSRHTSRALLEPLAGELTGLALRTVVLELNVAALEGDDEPDPVAHATAFFRALEEPRRA
jgi:hypothetical protein